MKCYICLTAPDEENSVYTDLLEATVVSARKNTSLEMIALYDGPHSHPCYQIMIENGVNVIDHVFSHKKYLETTYPKEFLLKSFGRVFSYDKLAGTFMRLDVPFIENKEEYVLYVDIDIMFMKDITFEDIPKPKYIAATAEIYKDINKMKNFNAGILVMNIKNMREKCSLIFEDLRHEKRNKVNIFDQGYLNQYCFHDMDILPLEYNWKPYWGINHDAKIIHYHGMKPGGNHSCSGFAMNDDVIIETLNGHPKDIDGYLYYCLELFSCINKNGNEWTSKFISKIFELFIMSAPDSSRIGLENHYSKKLKKIKNRYKKYLCILLLIIISLITGGLWYVI